MNIYVGNLPYSITETDLKEAFSEFGQVSSVTLAVDKFSGQSKGFGFVEMRLQQPCALGQNRSHLRHGRQGAALKHNSATIKHEIADQLKRLRSQRQRIRWTIYRQRSSAQPDSDSPRPDSTSNDPGAQYRRRDPRTLGCRGCHIESVSRLHPFRTQLELARRGASAFRSAPPIGITGAWRRRNSVNHE